MRSDIHSLPDRSHSGNTHCLPSACHFRENCQNVRNLQLQKFYRYFLTVFQITKMDAVITFVKCVDPNTNKTYYFNKITHEAQWSAPVTTEAESMVKSDIHLEKPYCNYVVSIYLFLPYSLLKWLQNTKNGGIVN